MSDQLDTADFICFQTLKSLRNAIQTIWKHFNTVRLFVLQMLVIIYVRISSDSL